MKVLIQVVDQSSVTVKNKKIAQIEKGMLLFVSFNKEDNIEIVKNMATKISKLRIFPDENDKTNLNITDFKGQILSIPQFTLYANLKKTNRPSFTDCLDFSEANYLFEQFNDYLNQIVQIKVEKGIFKEHMIVDIKNNGPFTIIVDSTLI